MTTDETLLASARRLGASGNANLGTVPRPADTTAARRLSTRVLAIASGEAGATAAHIDPANGGLVIAGASASATVKALRKSFPDLTMLVEPPSTAKWATREAPFDLDTSGLFPQTLDSLLDGQLHNGATLAVTPTCVFDAGDSAAMKNALAQVNELDRDDILFLVPIHHRWLDPANVKQLVAIVNRSRHPAAIALADSNGNPMERKGAVEGYRKLFAEVPWAMPWRADLAAFDALAQGARAAAIGQLPSLRRLAFPGKGGFSSDKSDMSPHVLLPHLLRYRRSSKMQTEWYASTPPDVCDCPHCHGRGIDRFSGSDEERLAAHLHNLYQTTAMRREIDGFTTEQVARWWERRLRDVEYECQALTGRINVQVKPTADVKEWVRGA